MDDETERKVDVGERTRGTCNNSGDTTTQLEQDIKRGERWLIGVGFAAVAVNIGIGIVYYSQLKQMRNATQASQLSAYAACVNAQIARATLLETQREEALTRAAVVAAMLQSAGDVQGHEAKLAVRVIDRVPTLHGTRLGVPYFIRNEGEADAANITVLAAAQIIEVGKVPEFSYGHAYARRAKPPNLKSGQEYPPSSEDPNRQVALDDTIDVVDYKQAFVSPTDDTISRGLGHHELVLMTYGRITYSDFAGQHLVQFCYAPYSIHTSQGPSRVHRTIDKCLDYNKRSGDPRVLANAITESEENSPISPIDCVKPEFSR